MKIFINNSRSKVEFEHEKEKEWIFDRLSLVDVQAEKAAQNGYYVEDTRIRLFNKITQRFPTGLLFDLKQWAQSDGVRVEEIDARKIESETLDCASLDMLGMTGKYAFQAEALKAWSEGPMPWRGVIKSPTGSGKGRIAVGAAKATRGHTLFLVHRGHLADDVASRWSELCPEEPKAGKIGAGVWDPGDRLTCATVQTLHRNRESEKFADLVRSVDGIILDECHTAPADSVREVLQACEGARRRLGLSGTPYDRADKRSLISTAILGPLCFSISAGELIDAQVIEPPQVYIVPCTQVDPKIIGNWSATYRKHIVRSKKRNAIVLACVKRAYSEGKTPGIIFTRQIAHAKELLKMTHKEGFNVEIVDGAKSSATRKNAIESIKRGDLDFIISTKVFAEGVDIPEIQSVVNAAAGKAVIDVLQQIGRGTRRSQGKSGVDVYEIGDKGDPVLHKHAKARVRAAQREGYACKVLDLGGN